MVCPSYYGKQCIPKETIAMTDQQIRIIGIELGKNWFHLVAMDERDNPIYRKKLNRNRIGEFAATLKP